MSDRNNENDWKKEKDASGDRQKAQEIEKIAEDRETNHTNGKDMDVDIDGSSVSLSDIKYKDVEYISDDEYEEDEESDEYDDDEYDDEQDEEYDDDQYEEYEEDEEFDVKGVSAGKGKKGLKVFLIAAASVIGVFAAVYLGFSVFFMSHFYFNTMINGVEFSAKTVKDVESYMKSQVDGYELLVLEKDNAQDTIKGTDIALAYKKSNDIEDALKTQNPLLWPSAFFDKKDTEIAIDVAYDDAALTQKIDALQCLQKEQTAPISAAPKFDGEKYVVEPEVFGTEVDRESLDKKIRENIAGFRSELNMEEEDCYKIPQYTAESEQVIKAVETLNNYSKASITYNMQPETEIVDKTVISSWLTWDADMNVTFNQEAVKAFMAEFGKRHDTVGATRTITTPGGKAAEVSGGTYGWAVDEAGEAQALIASIEKGEVVTREPLYAQTAAAHGGADWGSTYLEVDLSAQYMWYVVNGGVALETSVVTGEPIPEKVTPAGVYSILEMQRNKTLVGAIVPETGKPEYETPVAFWMRATWTGIGFHDATWQGSFGGNLNQIPGIGSHGCINMPYDQASALYDSLAMGTPVIMHY